MNQIQNTSLQASKRLKDIIILKDNSSFNTLAITSPLHLEYSDFNHFRAC